MKTIEVDDACYERLCQIEIATGSSKKHIVSQLSRVFFVVNNISRRRRRHSNKGYGKLSGTNYRRPIIDALRQLGGKGSISEITEIVHNNIKHKMSAIDYGVLQSGILRWTNTMYQERMKMVCEGILLPNSRKGIWELTSEYF